jgi:Matrixin
MRFSLFASRIVAAVFVGLCALLWAGRAQAYCREVTDYPPNAFDPAVSGCFTAEPDGGVLYPLFWRNQCVSYSFQQQGSKYISLSDATRVAAQAFATWSQAPCGSGSPSIQAIPFPPVDCDGANGSQEHSNIIIFRDDSWPHNDAANVIGYTTLTVDLDTGELFGANIEINTHDYTIVTDLADGGAPRPGTTMTLDLGTILTHEAGHFLGLAHSASSSAVMFAHYQPGTTALTPDDVAGICTVYPPGAQHSTSEGLIPASDCMPAPPLGFLPTECGMITPGTVTFVASGSSSADAGADPPPPCTVSSCAMARRTTGGAALELPVGAAIAIGAIARRRSRASRRARGALAIGGAAVALATLAAHDAAASVSISVLFEDLVRGASAAAIVSPLEKQAVWEGGHIATYTHVRVDQVMGGSLPGELWVRTLGGGVGRIGQIVEGEAQFAVGQASLVFLRPHVDPVGARADDAFVVVERAQGQFPVAGGDGEGRHLTQAPDVGSLIAPPPAHWDRAAQRLPAGVAPRLARDVLEGRTLRDAAREIAAAWPRMHP